LDEFGVRQFEGLIRKSVIAAVDAHHGKGPLRKAALLTTASSKFAVAVLCREFLDETVWFAFDLRRPPS
jgi:hypothetical protein